jgi:hypothetical protein
MWNERSIMFHNRRSDVRIGTQGLTVVGMEHCFAMFQNVPLSHVMGVEYGKISRFPLASRWADCRNGRSGTVEPWNERFRMFPNGSSVASLLSKEMQRRLGGSGWVMRADRAWGMLVIYGY